MKRLFYLILLATASYAFGQSKPIDLTNWQLELPTGYKASDWKLSNFQNDRFCQPFFYLDSIDGALVMEAYPAAGTSTASYTRNTLREQMQPGSSDVNWTMKEGGVIEAEIQVTKISQESSGKYHKTILLQLDGRTSEKQTKQLGLDKPLSFPLVKVYWENERVKVQRKKLKDEMTVGDQLFDKDSWEDDDSKFSIAKVGFDKFKVRIRAEKGRIEIQINDETPIIYRDISVRQWYMENYFTAGNYLQVKEVGAHCIVKYYNLKVTHEN